MNAWMIWFNDHIEKVSLFKWDQEQLKSLGDFTLEEIVSQAQQEPVLAFFPSEHVSFVETVLPKTSEKRLRLALPSLIEDHIASAPEDNFYALPQHFKVGEATTIAVIALDYLHNTLNACRRAGINLLSFSPDCFLLPAPKEGVHKMVQGTRVTVRSGALQGFSMQQEHAVLIMKELESLNSHEPGLYEVSPFDFQQAQFKPKPRKQSFGRMQWLYITLGLAFVLHLVALIIMGSVLNHQLDILKEKTLTLYAGVFPGATKVTSAKSLIERELQTRGSAVADPLLGLLASLSAALSQTPGATLESLEYQGNRLSVNLSAPSLDAVEQLNQALLKSGTPLEDQQINETGNSISVQFTLGESK